MTPWLAFYMAQSVAQVNAYAFHVALAANPWVDQCELRRCHREWLDYRDYRRIWGEQP